MSQQGVVAGESLLGAITRHARGTAVTHRTTIRRRPTSGTPGTTTTASRLPETAGTARADSGGGALTVAAPFAHDGRREPSVRRAPDVEPHPTARRTLMSTIDAPFTLTVEEAGQLLGITPTKGFESVEGPGQDATTESGRR